MAKNDRSMLVIGIVFCALAAVNLLLQNALILTLIQIVFGVPFVVIGFRRCRGKQP